MLKLQLNLDGAHENEYEKPGESLIAVSRLEEHNTVALQTSM